MTCWSYVNPERAARLLFVLGILMAAGSLLPWLDVLPGLHGDEAWVGLRAHKIARGARPLIGMNDYTGPLHQYLCAVVMSIWRFDVAGLRLTGVLLNLSALGFTFDATRRTLGVRTAALYCLLLVATPAFSLYSRIATEVTALSFCLAAAAAACLARRTRWLELSAGVLLGLGVWNHLIFAVVPPAFAAVGLVLWESLWRWLRVASGLVIVLLIRFALSPTPTDIGSTGSLAESALDGLSERAAVWLQLFAACLHGDVLFMRYVGRVELPSVPLFAALLLSCVAASTIAAFRPAERAHRALVLALISVLGGALLIAPYTADRYYLLALYFTPLFAAHWLERLKLKRSLTKLVDTLIVLFCLVQSARVAINFHAAHLATGGGVATLQLGQTAETSSHFVRSDRLYRKLAEAPGTRVYAQFFIVKPLAFYDLAERKLKFGKSGKAVNKLKPNERVVDYTTAAPAPKGALIDRSLPHFEIFAPAADRVRGADLRGGGS